MTVDCSCSPNHKMIIYCVLATNDQTIIRFRNNDKYWTRLYQLKWIVFIEYFSFHLLFFFCFRRTGFYTMRMLEPNATSNNSSVLNVPANGAGSLNGVAGLLQNAAGAPPMQTNLNSTATGKLNDPINKLTQIKIRLYHSELQMHLVIVLSARWDPNVCHHYLMVNGVTLEVIRPKNTITGW